MKRKEENMQKKSRIIALLLVLFLGGLGIHKFYLGQNLKGVLYIVFSITGIPVILAMIDAIKFLIWDDYKFNEYVIANRT
jgi:TM2 domain-containing membrane protein YozV